MAANGTLGAEASLLADYFFSRIYYFRVRILARLRRLSSPVCQCPALPAARVHGRYLLLSAMSSAGPLMPAAEHFPLLYGHTDVS